MHATPTSPWMEVMFLPPQLSSTCQGRLVRQGSNFIKLHRDISKNACMCVHVPVCACVCMCEGRRTNAKHTQLHPLDTCLSLQSPTGTMGLGTTMHSSFLCSSPHPVRTFIHQLMVHSQNSAPQPQRGTSTDIKPTTQRMHLKIIANSK